MKNQLGFSPVILLVIVAIISLVVLFKSQVLPEFNQTPTHLPNLESSPSATISPTSSPSASPSAKPIIKPSTAIPSPSVAPTVNNSPPSSGFSVQTVKSDAGTFTVLIGSADLHSTKVIVDTASDKDCSNDCPVLPLATYASRNGAYAGINGSFFCPTAYPSCAGKTNSFDTLLMNKNKVYFNSSNNVYSTIPAVIFMNGSARFIGQSLDWGRDTGIDGMIANYPMLVQGGNIAFAGSSDPKLTNKSGRSFVGASGSTIYIGVVQNATIDEAAKTIHAMGIQNALNLDDGGSVAMWWGGYKAGPGRDIPNAVLFVNR